MTRPALYLLALLAGCGTSTGDPSLPGDAAIADFAAAPNPSEDMPVPDLAGPDLGTVDLASPDLATVDLASADLAKPDLGGPGDGGVAGCQPPCAPGNLCVRDQIYGGALVLPMNGMCPAMMHLENNLCVRDPTYSCSPAPQGCSGGATCGCAGELCTMQQSCGYHCVSASGTEVDCECDVP